MKKVFAIIVGISLHPFFVNAQLAVGKASPIQQTPLLESTTAATLQGKLWNIVIENKEAEVELYPTSARVEEKKEAFAKLRAAGTQHYSLPKKTRTLAPVQGINFKGNQLHSLVPTDNSMAISRDGRIVSVDNWNLTYADNTGTIIKDSIVWNDFLNNNANFQNGKYDPRVIYDNVHDRFITIILIAPADFKKNKIVIAYSKTNNPMQGWNIYGITGNPLADSSWADYPNIGINNNELFINVNLFKGAPTYAYNQSVIYQISLADGYGAGSFLNYKVWAGNINYLDGKPGFTIVPALHGLGEAIIANKDMWFVSNWPDGDTAVNVFQITKELYEPNAQLISYQYSVPKFDVCANAFIYDPPTGYKDSISTGSSVVQNAFFLDSVLHYTFDANIDTGWCGIQYGRIDLRTQKASVKSFGSAGTVLAYPAVASFGFTEKDKSAVICYLQCDTSLYPQVCAVSIDDAMNFSNAIVLKKGDTTINMLYPPQYPNNPERWGDYTGIQRKYGEAIPEVWCAGAYAGNNSRKASYNTWISQLTNATLPAAVINYKNNNSKATVYPNPGYQDFTFTWQQSAEENIHIYIINTQGQLLKNLLNNELESGEHTIHFNKGALPAGMYYLVLQKSNAMEKVGFVVE